MEIVDYFEAGNKAYLLNEIRKSDWSAAEFLVKIIEENKFNSLLGDEGKLFLLMDGNNLLSFVTLTKQDCIEDEKLCPWLGFLFTFPEHRGHRYGQKLIDYAVSYAGKKGYRQVYLATDHVGLYEKYGFSYLENRIDVWGEDSRIYIKKI
ncbi:MAG: GNAT family N-acetyltransferase [Clostridium sp.]